MKIINVWKHRFDSDNFDTYTVLTECKDMFVINGSTGEKEYAGPILTANDLVSLDKNGTKIKLIDLPPNVKQVVATIK